MLHFSDPRPFQVVKVVPVIDGASGMVTFKHACEDRTSRTSPLDRYLEGWAEVNLDKILDATAAGYCFRDPFVGTFSRRSLHEYFDLLVHRCSRAGAVRRCDIAFELHGPMEGPSQEGPSHSGGIWFWREAPRIGLTGITQIEVGQRGVIGESVAYEANLASDMLYRAA
jgi:hypothetical protein